MRSPPIRSGIRRLIGIRTSPPAPPWNRTPSSADASAVTSNVSRSCGTKSSSQLPPVIASSPCSMRSQAESSSTLARAPSEKRAARNSSRRLLSGGRLRGGLADELGLERDVADRLEGVARGEQAEARAVGQLQVEPGAELLVDVGLPVHLHEELALAPERLRDRHERERERRGRLLGRLRRDGGVEVVGLDPLPRRCRSGA